MSHLAKLYPRLPGWLQGAAVFAYGWQLHRLRTGGAYRQFVREFSERDRFSQEQWREWQSSALKAMLRDAVQFVPYYRELHRAGRYPIEEVRTADDLGVLPTISKWEVSERESEFFADGARRKALLAEQTSGTTGTPVRTWISRTTIQRWYAAIEQRMRRWHGLNDQARHATLGARAIVPVHRQRPPFWRYNPHGRQLYMSIYHLRNEHLDAYLDALRRFRVQYLYGFATALDLLACRALETGRRDIRLQRVFSNAEPFLPASRERIERAFGCLSVDTYATSEKTFACFEFEGTMYVSPDVGVLETVDDDGNATPAETPGEVCGTGLLNRDFMLIRYRQGDLGTLAAPSKRRRGRFSMPVLRRIDGRHEDVLITPSGRAVPWAGTIFKAGLRIREAQIVQTAPEAVEVRVVPAAGYHDEADGAALREALAERLDEDMRIHVRRVPSIDRLPNGKFRTVIRECERPTPHEEPLTVS